MFLIWIKLLSMLMLCLPTIPPTTRIISFRSSVYLGHVSRKWVVVSIRPIQCSSLYGSPWKSNSMALLFFIDIFGIAFIGSPCIIIIAIITTTVNVAAVKATTCTTMVLLLHSSCYFGCYYENNNSSTTTTNTTTIIVHVVVVIVAHVVMHVLLESTSKLTVPWVADMASGQSC